MQWYGVNLHCALCIVHHITRIEKYAIDSMRHLCSVYTIASVFPLLSTLKHEFEANRIDIRHIDRNWLWFGDKMNNEQKINLEQSIETKKNKRNQIWLDYTNWIADWLNDATKWKHRIKWINFGILSMIMDSKTDRRDKIIIILFSSSVETKCMGDKAK